MALSARPIPNKSSTGFPAKVCLLNTGGGWRKEIAYCHAEDFSKNCNSLVSDRGTPRFNIGDDVASHVAPKQLHFGGEHVLCPIGSMPKFDHVLSNDVCIFEHTFQNTRVAKNLFGINGVTLHSYRYAWAERAKTVGYPERFAQEALGHNSKAVHRAYAKRALMKIPSLEEYEQKTLTKAGIDK